MKKFFLDANDKPSMMRLMSFLTMAFTLPLCYLHPEQATNWGAIIIASLGGKWLQHRKELK